MASHRCKECTLMRCDSPDTVCIDCIANNGGALAADPSKDVLKHLVLKYRIFSGNAAPATTATPSASAKITAAALTAMPLKDSAEIVMEWLDKSFMWKHSQKGAAFWADVYSALLGIHTRGTP